MTNFAIIIELLYTKTRSIHLLTMIVLPWKKSYLVLD